MFLAYMLLGAAALVVVLLIGRGVTRADPATLASIVRWAGGTLLVLIGLYVVLSGRAGYLFALVPAAFALLPTVRRLGALKRMWNRVSNRPGGQASTVETPHLRMILDHDTGALSGTVIAGRFTGRDLAEMNLDELLALIEEVAASDPESLRVLEAYLDRSAHRDWRQAMAARQRGGGPTGTAMSADEARQILGLGADATEAEIRAAHRRLMKLNHPDHGGSAYLAARINLAKEVLLGG